MSLRMVRPVGEPVSRLSAFGDQPIPVPAGYRAAFVTSGTAALACAMIFAKRRHGTDSPEVILPGYGCPDLVSAAVYAGVRARLVDTLPDSPFLEPGALGREVGPNTVAVVGAHFLGLGEDLDSLRKRLDGVLLIEDSAQRLPDESPVGRGDLIVHSFGRGKPGGALGGGLLMWREAFAPPVDADGTVGHVSWPARVELELRFALHRMILSDVAYGALSKVPALRLGETRYKPLNRVRELPLKFRAAASMGVMRARQLSNPVRGRLIELVSRAAEDTPSIRLLPGQEKARALLRLPLLLCEPGDRDRRLSRLRSGGIGATAMYKRPIADMGDLPIRPSGDTPRSREFADRLLTLPIHTGITEENVETIRRVLLDEA